MSGQIFSYTSGVIQVFLLGSVSYRQTLTISSPGLVQITAFTAPEGTKFLFNKSREVFPALATMIGFL